jgi:hypothetical protein
MYVTIRSSPRFILRITYQIVSNLLFERHAEICPNISLPVRSGTKDSSLSHSFITHSAVCPPTGPQPLPKPDLHKVRSTASSFKSQHPLLSLTISNSCLRRIPHISRESNSHSSLFGEAEYPGKVILRKYSVRFPHRSTAALQTTLVTPVAARS